jgi:uncharacterized protein
MPLLVNLRHLQRKPQDLQGELSAEELDFGALDEIIHVREALRYELRAEQLGANVLVQGRLEVVLDCECARCLKPFRWPLALEPWTCHLALEGEERAWVVNDCVDLTPWIREDTLLACPQHPLCHPECRGLPEWQSFGAPATSGARQDEAGSTTWAELDKLKF